MKTWHQFSRPIAEKVKMYEKVEQFENFIQEMKKDIILNTYDFQKYKLRICCIKLQKRNELLMSQL